MSLLNYLDTGLVSDQALDLMWRFANVERLDRWGVIPDLFLIIWIRDNTERLAPPFGWDTIPQLITFMRLNLLWMLIQQGLDGVAQVQCAAHGFGAFVERRNP